MHCAACRIRKSCSPSIPARERTADEKVEACRGDVHSRIVLMQCDSRHQKISGADIAVARNLQSFLALVDTGGIAGVIFAAPGTTRVAFQIDAMRLLPEIFRPHSAPVFPDAVLFGRLPDGLSASSRRRAVFDCAFFLGSACGSRIEQQGVW